MKLTKALLLLPLVLSLANCGKQVKVKGEGTKSPATNPTLKISADTEVTPSWDLVRSDTFVVEQTEGDYRISDRFIFDAGTQLNIRDQYGLDQYYGAIMYSTDGSFRMSSHPSSGRIFKLQTAYKRGSKTVLYYEIFDTTANYTAGKKDGLVVLVQE